MFYRRFTWLTAVIALVFASLLATPIAAATAHSYAIGAVVEAVDAHGHVHHEMGADEHDAIDHAHDVPYNQAATIVAIATWQPDRPGDFVKRIESAIRVSFERPPKSIR
ncbi:MAG: hypothetical protein JWQ22_2226 [Devosia sp.]|nr:hypothetical protein [Devosia sp.]